MKTKLIEFDLEKAKLGAKVVTRMGNSVRIVCCDRKGDKDCPLVALIYDKGYETPYIFDLDGKFHNGTKDYEYDLFIEDQEFEDGDILADNNRVKHVFIAKHSYNSTGLKYYCMMVIDDVVSIVCDGQTSSNTFRSATDDEKQKLYIELAKFGRHWNSQKKTFDKISKSFIFKPKDWCLMKDDNTHNKWCLCQFSYVDEYDFVIAVGGLAYSQCIPYEGNETLLGTTIKPSIFDYNTTDHE